MSAFPNWEKYAVVQRRPNSGCIPTGYEMLLRAAKIDNIDYETFQDDFDLDKDCKRGERPQNNFESVAGAINDKYPHVNFKSVTFPPGQGEDKLRFIEDCIMKQQPVLISLSLAPFGCSGWHIMPVVDITDEDLVLLNGVEANGKKITNNITKAELIRIHNEYEGGDDVAYLDNSQ